MNYLSRRQMYKKLVSLLAKENIAGPTCDRELDKWNKKMRRFL